MSRIEVLKRRFRNIAQPKAHERVLTRTSKLEVMTSTQAVRFRQLRSRRSDDAQSPPGEPARPHYPLPEACRKLGVPVNRILQAAAAGNLTCYLLSSDVRGAWDDDGSIPEGKRMPRYMALKAADCRDIETWGSVNAHELLHPDAHEEPGGAAERPRLRLREPLWVDPERLVLKHPLPEATSL